MSSTARIHSLMTAIALGTLSQTATAQDYLVYVGTYTGGASAGIYVFRFDSESGSTTGAMLAAETENPSFVAIHPERRVAVCRQRSR